MEENLDGKLLCLLLLLSAPLFSQVFVPIDKDTHEFIEDVNYTLYNNEKLVFTGATLNDAATKLPSDKVFDSISFSRVDYETLGFAKSSIDSVIYLSKKVIYLDELVVSSGTEKHIVLGETNRFVNSQSRPVNKELNWGILLVNTFQENLQLDKMIFHTAQVKHKTAYKINFSEVRETTPSIGHQFIDPGKLYYSSDILYISPKDKSRVEVVLPADLSLPPNKPVLVWIQVIEYYDKEGQVFDPVEKERTKIKFQLSNRSDLYSKTYNISTKQTSSNLININVMINYDFATAFFKKPHKSILVTPAILLYASKKK